VFTYFFRYYKGDILWQIIVLIQEQKLHHQVQATLAKEVVVQATAALVTQEVFTEHLEHPDLHIDQWEAMEAAMEDLLLEVAEEMEE
jgi:hypothetical protein